MKKIFTVCFAALGMFLVSPEIKADDYNQGYDYNNQGYDYSQGYDQGSYAQGYEGYEGAYGVNYGGDDYAQQEQCPPCDKPCGVGYQLYCHYTPCYYNEWHTVCVPKYYQKKCCRYVPKQYEKCCVKYVPQYYTQTYCRYEPEYYYTTECCNEYKKVCKQKCKYVPKYYYKKVCTPTCDIGYDNAGCSSCQ